MLCNVFLITAAVAGSVIYANNVRASQVETKALDFISTVESMKSVSQNYLDSERGYVENWAAYINEQQMTLPEALEFLRNINTNPARFIHIVDMDTFDAWTASYPPGKEQIDTYHQYQGELTECQIVGRYQLEETRAPAVSVGIRITLKSEIGTKDYLMLRAIPAEVLKKTWVFLAEYQSAEVGIMTKRGDYVIQSSTMKSLSFPEYIRGVSSKKGWNACRALCGSVRGRCGS